MFSIVFGLFIGILCIDYFIVWNVLIVDVVVFLNENNLCLFYVL